MNKVKWGFSLFLALFLVGILSTTTFASDPYNLQTIQNGSGLGVSFTGNTNDAENTSFDLVLKDGVTTVKTYTVLLNSSKQGTFTIPSGDLTVGKVYTVELYYTSDTNHANKLSVSSGLFTNDPHNTKLYQSPDPRVDVNGSGLVNSNATGYNNIKKQRSGQKVHGFYQNNTNSCASCHQTHTSDNGDSLLFKDGTYSTCSACHDGTTGAYNSFSATTSSTPNSIDGTFDITGDTVHGSIHQADGSIKITAAPGGNSDPNSQIWNQNFDCASCHAPHGGGTGDENNLNIDPLGWGGVQYVSAADGGTKDQQNGKLFKNLTVYDSVPTTEGDPYILVRFTATTADISTDTKSIGYLYSRAGVKPGDQVIQTYRWDGTEYVRDYSLWLRDIGYKNPLGPFQNANTVLKDSSGTDITAKDMTVIWRDGFAFGAGVANVSKADVSIGIDVETTSNVRSLYDPTYNGYIPDSGAEMTKYCAACHTDYMTDSATGKTGVLTGFHRHTESGVSGITDQLTCVRCHFAHGTKSAIMKDSSDNLAGSNTEVLSSTDHSSALRRYINMDSCYTSGCHTSTDTSSNLYLKP
jgi:hypothetical protein